ncbi:MAG: hypothetical protein IPL13_11185 [Saprospiraceae bacterium]|nr:hypothetical protein [Candidatus Brachybacter algidus]
MKHGWEIKRLDDACEVEYGTRVVQKKMVAKFILYMVAVVLHFYGHF